MFDALTVAPDHIGLGTSFSALHGFRVLVRIGADPADHLTPAQARILAGRYAGHRNAVLARIAAVLMQLADDAAARNADPAAIAAGHLACVAAYGSA